MIPSTFDLLSPPKRFTRRKTSQENPMTTFLQSFQSSSELPYRTAKRRKMTARAMNRRFKLHQAFSRVRKKVYTAQNVITRTLFQIHFAMSVTD
jgi:hypothetical protein